MKLGPHSIIILYFIAMIGLWKAVPAGVFFNLPPLIIGIITFSGSFTTTLLVFLFGGRIKRYLLERSENRRVKKRRGKIQRLVDKYGLVGLGLLGTITVGSAVSVAMGIIITDKKKELFLWITAGIFFWSVALTALATLAYDVFNRLTVLS